MYKRFLVFFLSSILVNITFSETDKFRITYLSDPSTSITIGWNQKSGNNAIVYYDTTDYDILWEKYTLKAIPDRFVDYKGMKNNFAHLQNLNPNTIYYFVVKDSDGASCRYSFKTISDNSKDNISFIAGGDTRTDTPLFGDNTCRARRKNSFKMIAKLRLDFMAFLGDFTFTQSSAEWQDWLDDWQLSISADGRITPILVTNGNHDSGISLYNLFDTPSEACYYALSFGGNLLRFYTLNDELKFPGAQTTWLAGDLASNSNNCLWKFVQYHRPMRVHRDSHPNNQEAVDYWFPLFAKNKVNVVSEGHTHTIKVTWPIINSTAPSSDEGFIRDDANGIVFIGEGTMGAPIHLPTKNYQWTRNSEGFDGFQWIWISSSKAEIRTVKYANQNEVNQLNDDTKFTIPQHIDLWKPCNGSVVEINCNKSKINKIENLNTHINKVDVDIDTKDIMVQLSETIDSSLIQIVDKQGKVQRTFELNSSNTKQFRLKSFNIPSGKYILKLFTTKHAEEIPFQIGREY